MSTDTKFTPGPWLFRPKSSTFHKASETHPYGECIFALEEGYMDEQLPSEADINLIAAAPDMYRVLAWINRKGGMGLDVHDEIDAVLAKARGEG